jgi:hypothetical protein
MPPEPARIHLANRGEARVNAMAMPLRTCWRSPASGLPSAFRVVNNFHKRNMLASAVGLHTELLGSCRLLLGGDAVTLVTSVLDCEVRRFSSEEVNMFHSTADAAGVWRVYRAVRAGCVSLTAVRRFASSTAIPAGWAAWCRTGNRRFTRHLPSVPSSGWHLPRPRPSGTVPLAFPVRSD